MNAHQRRVARRKHRRERWGRVIGSVEGVSVAEFPPLPWALRLLKHKRPAKPVFVSCGIVLSNSAAGPGFIRVAELYP